MKRLSMVLLLVTLLVASGWAASNVITTNGTTCALSTTCLVVNLPQDKGGATLTLSGTWTGTISFEATGDGGVTWSALAVGALGGGAAVTSSTGNGTWQVNTAGFTGLRMRASASMTGSAIATITSSAAAARSGTSGGGGGGGSTIANTTNVIKGDGAGNGLASSVVDDGTNATQTPNGLSTEGSGNLFSATNSTTVANKTVCFNSSEQAIICPITTKAGVAGVAVTVGGGIVRYCWSQCTVLFDNQTAIGDSAVPSTTVAGELHDTGSTTETTATQNMFVRSVNAGAGTTALAAILTPDQISGGTNGGGKGTNVQVNGSNTQPNANFNSTTPVAESGYLNVKQQSSASGNTTSTSGEVQYGSASVKGVVQVDGSTITAANGVISSASTSPSATYGGLIGGNTGGGSCVSAPWWSGCSSTTANHMQSFPSFWSKLTQYVVAAGTINNGYVNQFEASSVTGGQTFQNTTADFGRLVTGPVANGVSYQEQAGVPPFNVVAGAFSYLKANNTLSGGNTGGQTGGWSALTVGTTAQPYDWTLATTFSLSSTHYSGPGYTNDAGQTTEAKVGIVMPLAGAFDYQCTVTNGAQSGTGSLVQTLDRTAAGVTSATSVVTTITSSNTNGSDDLVCDLTHSQAVTAGDYYTWSWVNNATATSTTIRSTSMRFTPTTPKQTGIVWPLGTATIGVSAYAVPAFAWGNATAGLSSTPMPLSGTVDNLYCLLTTAPGTNPQAVTVYLDGIATALTLDLPTAGCTNSICSDLTHSFSFTALQGIALFFGSHTGSAPAVSSCSARITWN